ncbi:MAG TPA: hypothetical protein VKD72_25690 [Gemmataceae bacterium]|nr:hypothetical protein [Gemmataceae bacterium]
MAEERWRKPLKVLHHEHGNDYTIQGGRLVRTTRLVFDRESTERIRHGYACAKCLAVFERPWPEKCRDCGAPIRALQAEYFLREYDPTPMHLGSRINLDDELASLHERVAKGEDSG